ncbi:hypothetical protein BJ165DRAFT_1405853 [Panaeolus papilionaceus]|nr:hypothetical protein BJ165DRAFT_1405853 [Panaeolus papilionaceus]
MPAKKPNAANAAAPAKKNAPKNPNSKATNAGKAADKASGTVKPPAPCQKPGTAAVTTDKENAAPDPDANGNAVQGRVPPRPTGKAKQDRLAQGQSRRPSQPDSNTVAAATATSKPVDNTTPANALSKKPANKKTAQTASDEGSKGSHAGTEGNAAAGNATVPPGNSNEHAEVESLKAQLTAERAKNASLVKQQSRDSTHVIIPEKNLIPKPANTTRLANAMRMDDGLKGHTEEYLKIRHDVYRRLIQLGVHPETDTIRSLGFGRVSSIVNVIRKEMPVFERYHQAWPIVEIIQSLIKNRRHTLALKQKNSKPKPQEEKEEEEAGQSGGECNSSNEEDNEDEDEDGVAAQEQGAEEDDDDGKGTAGDDDVAPPPMDVDNNNDDGGDDEMDVTAPTNSNSAYISPQDDIDEDLMENPPSPIQADDDDQDVHGAKTGKGTKRKASKAQSMETGREAKRPKSSA